MPTAQGPSWSSSGSRAGGNSMMCLAEKLPVRLVLFSELRNRAGLDLKPSSWVMAAGL